MNEKVELIKKLMAMEAAEKTSKVTTPSDILPVVEKYRNRKQEHFIVVTLDGSHKVIRVRVVSKGIVNRCLVHPREIFRKAITDNAVAIIAVHNHPSGGYDPSSEDIEITKRIKDAGKIIGIELLDHIVIAKYGYYSFLEECKI